MFSINRLALIFLLSASISLPALAGQQQDDREEKGATSTFMSPATYNRINKAQKAIEEGKYQEAIAELLDLAEDVKEKPYEYAVVMQTLGWAYAGQDNWEKSAEFYQRALNMNALPPEPEKNVIYMLAQIYAMMGEFQKTVDLLTEWFKTAKNPPPDAYIILANAYAAQDKYREAYPYVQQAIAKAESPKEDWYKLALGIQYELKKYPEAAQTLELLVANWPDKELYWRQLSGVYIELGQDIKALSTLATAYEKGLITESNDILNLVRLYMLNEVPFKAGSILEKSLENESVERTQKNYELLSQAWVQAREYERGIAALSKAAALAEDGELYVRAAQLEMSIANWKGAVEAAQKAVEKGGLDSKKTGQAWLLVGTAAAEQKQFDTAINAFEKARGYPETRQTASQWLNFVQTEQQVSSLN